MEALRKMRPPPPSPVGLFLLAGRLHPMWQPRVNGLLPPSRNAQTVTVVGTKLFLFGGHSGNKHLRDLHILDTETMTWSQVRVAQVLRAESLLHSLYVIAKESLCPCPAGDGERSGAARSAGAHRNADRVQDLLVRWLRRPRPFQRSVPARSSHPDVGASANYRPHASGSATAHGVPSRIKQGAVSVGTFPACPVGNRGCFVGYVSVDVWAACDVFVGWLLS